MQREELDTCVAIFRKDQKLDDPTRPKRKVVPSGNAAQDEIWAIEAIIAQRGEQLKHSINALQEHYANDVAPFVARLHELKGN